MFLFTARPYAQVRLDTLKNGTFLMLSEQDKEDTIKAMTQKVEKDLKITRRIDISFYDAADWPAIATNSALPDTKWDTLQYNMAYFHDTKEADSAGETVEHYLIKTIAHEVRHTYQVEHINDDSDYGRSVKNAKYNYTAFYNDVNSYLNNFLEVDARNYGMQYADNFLKGAKTANISNINVQSTNIKAKDGKIFDAQYYYNTYPDVAKVFGTNVKALLNHYNTYGIKEGRTPSASTLTASNGKTFN